MRKLIMFAVAAMALAVPSIASADVQRCASPVTDTSIATFTATTPYGQVGQWEQVWTREYTVTVEPSRTFTGTGKIYRADGTYFANETITGSFGENTVSFTASYANVANEADFSYTMTNAPTDGTTATTPSATVPAIPFNMDTKVTAPQFTATTTTDLNHGEYVSSVGGGKVAAQKCAGMPLVSKAPKTP